MRNMNELEPWEEAKTKLGEGSFGTVYAGFLKDRQGTTQHRPRLAVSIKVINNIPETVEEQKKVMREVEVARKLRFPSLSSILYFSTSSERWCTVSLQAKCSLGAMLKSARNGAPRSWENAAGGQVTWNSTKRAICAIGIAAGLAFMHKKRFIHRDMKPENVLLDENMYPMISDFGLARELPKDLEALTQCVGTPLYMAPEILQGGIYGEPADVYAYGMLLYELVTTKTPFQGEGLNSYQLSQSVLKGRRPQIDGGVAEEWKSLIEKCWDQEPEARPTMEEVVDMLKDVDFSTFEAGINEGEVDAYREMITDALKKAE